MQYVSRPRLVRSRLIRPGELEASVVRWRRYGAFIMAAIAGWDDAECLLVHELLQGITGAHSFASKVLSARPDRFRRDELALRSFVRSLFLREASEGEAVAWLSRLLAPWPLVFRAKLLYLVYGPCCQHAVFWDVPSVPQSAVQSELLVTALSDLGSALRSLHEHGLGWTHDDTVTVLEELIVLPRAWLPLNAARLLCSCGRDIAVLVLASKLVNGRDSDVATFLFNMLLVDCRSATSVPLVLNVVLDLRGLFPGRRHLSLLPEISDSLLRSAVDFHIFDGINGNEEVCHALLSTLAVLLNGFCEQAAPETAPEE
ncbi:F-box only protein 47-like [Ixodes scapularis]|uniref:F-box only protein 47-like n=1 Tax=Ixodes scapularis TaxID=6945 RepID=UPI001AD62132|nr:F-box only protein 47-like [Ixodes scapularis]